MPTFVSGNRFLSTSPLVVRYVTEVGRRAELLDCVKPEYRGPERRLCPELDCPPLISSRSPALLRPTPRGARYQRDTEFRVMQPWGEETPYRVFVARYGAIRTPCQLMRLGSTLILACPGEPERDKVSALVRVAKAMGYEFRVAVTRVYDVGTMKWLAERLPRLKRVLLTARGVPQLIVAALRYAVEELGYERDELPAVYTCYDPSTTSAERNIVKSYVDWMCGNGDEVACYASKYFHVPYWHEVVRPVPAEATAP